MKTETKQQLPKHLEYRQVDGYYATIVADGREQLRMIADTPLTAAMVLRYNSHDDLLAAAEADLHDLREIRNGIDGLDGDNREMQRLVGLVDGRIAALQAAIRKARP